MILTFTSIKIPSAADYALNRKNDCSGTELITLVHITHCLDLSHSTPKVRTSLLCTPQSKYILSPLSTVVAVE